MLYKMKNGRTVNLYDPLVNEYKKMSPIEDCIFELGIINEYDHIPSEEEVSDEELSLVCNETMIYDLKAAMLLPKALEYIEKI